MKNFLFVSTVALAIYTASSRSAFSDAIEGMWKTDGNVLLKISNCGGQFCVDVADGEYKGNRSGKIKPHGDGVYKGTLKQFSTGISFNGTVTLAGNNMDLIAKKFGITVKKTKWKRN